MTTTAPTNRKSFSVWCRWIHLRYGIKVGINATESANRLDDTCAAMRGRVTGGNPYSPETKSNQ